MLKNLTKIIELETESEWKVTKRTRGQDVDNGTHTPTVTWVLVLENSKGERRFIPETRVWDWYKLP